VKYDEERPAFIFTTTDYGININNHPVGSQFPKANQDQSFLSPPSTHFSSIVRHSDSPQTLEDWIYTDRPQIHIHVAVFQDATLLTMTCLHTFTDAVARTNFFNAWIAVLRGHEEEVPAFVPYDQDPLESLGRTASSKSYSLFNKVLTGLSLLMFGLWYFWDLFWFPEVDEYLIRLPERALNRIREDAMQQLDTVPSKEGKKPFISEGDVVVGWWVRTMVKALDVAPNRTITVMTVFNVWSLFPEMFPDHASGLIGNSIFYSYTLLSANKVLEDSKLKYIASANREALVEHRTRQQVEAMAAIQRAKYKMIAPVVGPSNVFFLAASNQQMGKNFETDWSAAVVKQGGPVSERPHALGQPAYINYIEHCNGYSCRNVVRIIGKDAGGNWHLLFKTRTKAWPAIHKELVALIEAEKQEG
jgi:hypothetical protein